MNSEKKYKITSHSAMEWAKHELDSVGRIAAVEDTDIQYTYAMCTVNSMLHLRKALTDISENPNYSQDRSKVLETLAEVDRVIAHLIKDYAVDLNAIRTFNTRKIMGNISKFNSKNTTRRVNVETNTRPMNARPMNAKPMNARPMNARPMNARPMNAKPMNAKPMNAKPPTQRGFFSFLGL